jgi:hypothetical protein
VLAGSVGYSKTMRILILILLCMVAASASAKIFKHVDKDGNITYTDVPASTEDKAVQSQPMTTFKPPPISTSGTGNQADQKQTGTSYDSLRITSPENNAVIRANSGMITVDVQSLPGLDVEAGHRYVILVDGQPKQSSQSNQISVSDLSRGSHSFTAQIEDKDNKVLASSNAVQIDILRTSILNPSHPANRPTPP